MNTIPDTRRLEPGELVNIHINGARFVGEDHGHREFTVPSPHGAAAYVLYLARGATAQIERVAPKEWPPQLEDLWRDRLGGKWFATGEDHDRIHLVATDGTEDVPDSVLIQFGPLRLVHRDGWTPDTPSTVDEPEPDERAATIAGLLAFADLLATRTDIEAPHIVDGQVDFHGEEGLAEARRIAVSLGVELGKPRDTRDSHQRWAQSCKIKLGGGVRMTLYACGLDEPRCPSCGEPETLLASGAVGHSGDERGNPCPGQPDRLTPGGES